MKNKKIYRYVFKIMAYVLAYFASIWTFNHINAWLGIIIAIITTVLLILNFININEKQKK